MSGADRAGWLLAAAVGVALALAVAGPQLGELGGALPGYYNTDAAGAIYLHDAFYRAISAGRWPGTGWDASSSQILLRPPRARWSTRLTCWQGWGTAGAPWPRAWTPRGRGAVRASWMPHALHWTWCSSRRTCCPGRFW